MDENFATLLEAVTDAVVALEPDRVAVIQGDRRRTWAALDERAARLARHLAAAGVAPGDRVGIGLYNSIEYVETLYAVLKLRAVPVNVNYRYQARELEHILTYTGAAGIVVGAELSARLATVVPRVASLRSVVTVGAGAGAGFVDYGLAVSAPAMARQERSGSDQVIILTGGTTGQPKGVVWDNAGICTKVTSAYTRAGVPVPRDRAELQASVVEAVRCGTAPVMLPASPLMHGTGFFFSLGNLLRAGRIVTLVSRGLDAAELWQAVEKHRVEELAIVGDAFAVPMLAELDAATARDRPYDIGSLRRVVSSGVLWSPDVKRRLLEAGEMTLQDSIASTEGGPYGVSLVGPDPGSVSSRFTLPPNARVISADGADVVPGSGLIGELASTGVLPLGYLDDPQRTESVFRVLDGVRYAVPGDAATIEADGTLTLLGRGSGVINTGGEKVFAEEVEQALVEHPAVRDAVVVGMPDDRWGSAVTALVAVVPGQHLAPQELREHVGHLLAGYKRPRQIFFLDTLERTMSGKVDRRWAQERARELATRARGSAPVVAG